MIATGYRSLTQRVNAAARKSQRDTGRAVESFYLDRLLCRVFSEDEPSFVLKGGQSQLARRLVSRESRDIDLVGRMTQVDEALEELKRLASKDLHDFIEFRFAGATPIPVSQEYRTGYAVEFIPILGGVRPLNRINVDLVVDETPPESYELVSPASRLDIDGLITFDYAVQLIEERVADKVCATMQMYGGRPSSRVKDLVDLVASMLWDEIDASILSERLSREILLRHMGEINLFRVPDSWKTSGFEAFNSMARECGFPEGLCDVSGAEQAVAEWIAPVLDRTALGLRWDHEKKAWFSGMASEPTCSIPPVR